MPAFTLDIAGGAEVLKVLVADEIAAFAQQIAAIAGPEAVAEIVEQTGNARRARAKVTVPAHIQAKDGVLSRAVSEVGLEFKPQKQRDPKPKRDKETPPKKTRTATDKKTKTTKARQTKKKPSA